LLLILIPVIPGVTGFALIQVTIVIPVQVPDRTLSRSQLTVIVTIGTGKRPLPLINPAVIAAIDRPAVMING